LVGQVSLPATAVAGVAVSPSGGTSISQTQRARSEVVTHPTYRVVYYAPEIKSFVKIVTEQYDSESVRSSRDVVVLTSFKAGQ